MAGSISPFRDGLPARAVLETRLKRADAFVHMQDLPETDLLLAEDYATHEAGFAAALVNLGGVASLYHLDATRPETCVPGLWPKKSPASPAPAPPIPRWIRSMMRHSFRGGAEIAATLDHMAAFAHLAGVVPPHLFDLYHGATLGDPKVVAFLRDRNPQALAAMQACFAALAESGLWHSRSNSLTAGMG